MKQTNRERELEYVPILKTKSGERWALAHLMPETRAKIRPLLELHTLKGVGSSQIVEEIFTKLEDDWADRTFYLDGIWMHGQFGDPIILADVFQRRERTVCVRFQSFVSISAKKALRAVARYHRS